MRRNAFLFVAISVLSGFGGGVLSLVAGIWILDLTGSPGVAALAGLCVYAPQLAGPWLGAALDRVPRRGLVIAANLVRAGCVLGLLAVHHAGDSGLIFALSAQGGGSILGGLAAGRLIRLRGPVMVGCAGATLFAAGCLIRCLPWWPAMLTAAVISGVGLPWTLVAALTAVQVHTPPALLGRVAGTANTVMFGPLALAIPLGSAAAHLGGRLSLITAAAACLAAAVVWRAPSPAR